MCCYISKEPIQYSLYNPVGELHGKVRSRAMWTLHIEAVCQDLKKYRLSVMRIFIFQYHNKLFSPNGLNSLPHMATEIWVNIGSGTIIACCMPAPSHYLNQCWLEIIGIHPSRVPQEVCKIWWQRLLKRIEDFHASTWGQWVKRSQLLLIDYLQNRCNWLVLWYSWVAKLWLYLSVLSYIIFITYQ